MRSSGDRSLLDRNRLVKILQRLGSDSESEVLAAARLAHSMVGGDWTRVIPNSHVKASAREDAPPFVESLELTFDEAAKLLIERGSDDRREMARTLLEARRRGDTITGQGIRLLHKYANEVRRRA